jgi:pyruvate dehydrogenase E1 component alpha subunit
MPGQVVDGQDVDVVVEAMSAAVDRARTGGGPTLLEMKTYRYSGHSRSDAATYRPAGELDQWKQRDPIEILASRLDIDASGLAPMAQEVKSSIDAVVREVLDAAAPGLDDMFAHVYAGGQVGATGADGTPAEVSA